MANEEMNAILTYLAKQGEGVAKTVREITDNTGLTSLVVRKKLAKSAKDTVPLVEIGKTEDMLDGYKLTSYGLASVSGAAASGPAKKAAKKPAATTRKATTKKVTSGPVTVEKSDVSVIEHKIASYLVKEGKKKPVFGIAQAISENQDDVEKALVKMDSDHALASELLADFNERVYSANDKTKSLASAKAPVVKSAAKSKAKTTTKESATDLTVVDNAVVQILKKEKELAGKALLTKVAAKAKSASADQVEQRITKLVADGAISEKPKGRGKTYSLASTAKAAPAPAQRAAKKAAAPTVARKAQPASAAPSTTATQSVGAGSEIGAEMSSLMGMLERSMKDDLTSAGPHASDALEKVREYMKSLEDEVQGWRKLASTFVTGAKGIVE